MRIVDVHRLLFLRRRVCPSMLTNGAYITPEGRFCQRLFRKVGVLLGRDFAMMHRKCFALGLLKELRSGLNTTRTTWAALFFFLSFFPLFPSSFLVKSPLGDRERNLHLHAGVLTTLAVEASSSLSPAGQRAAVPDWSGQH